MVQVSKKKGNIVADFNIIPNTFFNGITEWWTNILSHVVFLCFFKLLCFLSRMLFVLSGKQIGVGGTLQDYARWKLRAGVAGRHEVPYPETIVPTAAQKLNNFIRFFWFDEDTNSALCKDSSVRVCVCICVCIAQTARWSTCPNWSRSKLTGCKLVTSSTLCTGKVNQSKVRFLFFFGPVSVDRLVPSSGQESAVITNKTPHFHFWYQAITTRLAGNVTFPAYIISV